MEDMLPYQKNYKNIDIVFFIEHKDREIQSIKLIAKKLNNEFGYKSIILSTVFHAHKLLSLKPKIIIFPYLLNQNDWPIRLAFKLYGNSVEYMTMNWEQLLFPVNQKYKKPQDNFVKNQVLHIAWDEDFKKFLTINSVKNQNIKITGNPAHEVLNLQKNNYDYWRKKFSDKYSLNINKKWIFFPMNYAWAFSSDIIIEGKIKRGYPQKEAWIYREYCRNSLNKFSNLLNQLSQIDNIEVILRPHPSIIEDDYINFFTNIGFNNLSKEIHIIKDFTIHEWIIASDIIGSSLSSSVWDAHLIGKKAFLFDPIEKPDFLKIPWNDKVDKCNSVNDIICYLDSQTEYKANFNVINSVNNIANFIDININQKSYSEKNYYNINLKDWTILFKRIFLKFLLRTNKAKSYKDDFFTPHYY